MTRPDHADYGFYLRLRSQPIIPQLLHEPQWPTVRTVFDSTAAGPARTGSTHASRDGTSAGL